MKCFYLSVKSETLRLQKYCNSEKKIELLLPLNLWEKKPKAIPSSKMLFK